MLQQVASEVKDIQRKYDDKKGKHVHAIVDASGKIIHRPMHRNEFRRTVAKPNYFVSATSTTRHYFESVKTFENLLKIFNTKTNQEYISVGYANVRLHFCLRCYDNYKTLPLDMYFVNRNVQFLPVRHPECFV